MIPWFLVNIKSSLTIGIGLNFSLILIQMTNKEIVSGIWRNRYWLTILCLCFLIKVVLVGVGLALMRLVNFSLSGMRAPNYCVWISNSCFFFRICLQAQMTNTNTKPWTTLQKSNIMCDCSALAIVIWFAEYWGWYEGWIGGKRESCWWCNFDLSWLSVRVTDNPNNQPLAERKPGHIA